MDLPIRPRRNRRTPALRALNEETRLSVDDLIYPLFIQEGGENTDIEAMPGCSRWSLQGLIEEAAEAHALGINAIVLFPAIAETLKTSGAEESYNPEGLVPRAIRALKDNLPNLAVITDVALDPYNADGHDGLVKENAQGELIIQNDETVEVLIKQALCHAEAGADIIAPSDMMDGRIRAIRSSLDAKNHQDIALMAYTAKYASAYYGPFRGALESAPKAGDKKTYQMNPANSREALRELAEDEAEGADIVMVKPAGAYLDIITKLREHTTLPVAAYQVSGEYLMIKSAAASGWVDEEAIVQETLLGIKRAGADMILSYFAKQVAVGI